MKQFEPKIIVLSDTVADLPIARCDCAPIYDSKFGRRALRRSFVIERRLRLNLRMIFFC